MKRSNLTLLIVVAVVAALISFFVSGLAFNSPSKRTKVPVVQAFNPNFPDVKNDPAYQLFMYPGALDPTQPIQIGNTNNTAPFNSQ
ncbi:MAG: hypothetical protein Q7R60_03475 [bacterium]|nr:hypothetical protein [bacterium]